MTQPQPQLPASAPLWRRFAAMGYDILVLGGVSMGYGALSTAGVVVLTTNPNPQNYSPMLHGPLFFIGWVLVILVFYCLSWCKTGQTLGMRAWRIRLVSITTLPPAAPNLKQALLRSAAGLAGLLCLGGGYWYRWRQPQGDCWHDVVSQTRVIQQP